MPNHSHVTPFVVEGRTIPYGGSLWVSHDGTSWAPALVVGLSSDGRYAYVEIQDIDSIGSTQVSPQQCRLTCETCDNPITRKRLSLTGWTHVVSDMVPCGGPDPAYDVRVNDETVTRYEHDNIYRHDPMAFAHPA